MTPPELRVPFIKMNGLGNEFVIFDARKNSTWVQQLTSENRRKLAQKERGGIGYDQLILLEEDDPSFVSASGSSPELADALLRIYNADGGEVGACGNATRCVARLIMDETGLPSVRLRSRVGLLWGRRVHESFSSPSNSQRAIEVIEVDMGPPEWRWSRIPLRGTTEEAERDAVFLPLAEILPDLSFLRHPALKNVSALSMGNPHLIFFLPFAEEVNLGRLGPVLERHPFFPEGVNISLASWQNPKRLHLEVWERGVGRTQACGTAACAAVVAGRRRGICAPHVQVHLPGGILEISWSGLPKSEEEKGERIASVPPSVLMRGATEKEFEGMVHFPDLTWHPAQGAWEQHRAFFSK